MYPEYSRYPLTIKKKKVEKYHPSRIPRDEKKGKPL
jgi:hypothetical protein